ncbi:MAG: polysaccharide deacetylase family protein [Aquificaceae bacterium]|nr:polysaccharide deacetylase family protein [Aquificaceae bacterium]MCX7989225.1 polysaccharide deacetylase family protein [Aquificaceae bacterium]MDW8295090.1 polysaccharide deacetylase family protein [Aquificaceae bacterium]
MSLALVELHDVSPYYRAEFLSALELLEEVGCHRFSLLVVPYFWERAPLGEDREFLSLIKSTGGEVLLHGYTHKGKKRFQDILWTDGEGEFGGLDLQETYERVRAGFELFEYLGLKTEFFVPPAWIGNPYLEDVLYSLAFRGVAYRWHIKDLTEGVLIKSPALTFSNRHIFSWLSLKLVPEFEKLYSRHHIMRLALHMADFRDRRKLNLWKDLLEEVKKSRRWTSYGELFSKGGPSSSFEGFQPAGRMVQ